MYVVVPPSVEFMVGKILVPIDALFVAMFVGTVVVVAGAVVAIVLVGTSVDP